MEAYESVVAIALEADDLVVSAAVKFPVRRQTRKAAYPEFQEHGYEVDLVGARRDQLVLASVKSFFGSQGVAAPDVLGTSASASRIRRYALLNDPDLRASIVHAAATRYGYPEQNVRLRLYVGKFAAPTKGHHEAQIRAWAETQLAGGGPIEIYSATDVIGKVREEANRKQYRDDPVLATIKVLESTGQLRSVEAAISHSEGSAQ